MSLNTLVIPRWAILTGILGIFWILRLHHSACPSQDDTKVSFLNRLQVLGNSKKQPMEANFIFAVQKCHLLHKSNSEPCCEGSLKFCQVM